MDKEEARNSQVPLPFQLKSNCDSACLRSTEQRAALSIGDERDPLAWNRSLTQRWRTNHCLT